MHVTPRRSARTALTALVAATLLLAGCTSADTNAAEAHTSGPPLSPVGDAGAWFSDAYARGVAGSYATSNRVCGIAGGWVIEAQSEPDLSTTILARDPLTNRVAWKAEQMSCASGGAIADEVVAVPANGSEIRVLDAATGAERSRYPLPRAYAGALPVTTAGDVRVFDIPSYGIAGLTASGEAWHLTTDARAAFTALSDGHLGIDDAVGHRARIVDGRTGDVVAEFEYDDSAGSLTWASDGYVLRINHSDPEYAFFDLTGREIDRTTGSSQYTFVPAPRDGVLFPIADHLVHGRDVGIDATGRIALFQDERQRDFTRAGSVELPSSIISLRGVSADDELLLFPNDAGNGYRVIDANGATVWDWGAGASSGAHVVAGYIVITSGSSTQVLLPR